MAVTIYDIAKGARVSIATVSRVLNGSDNVSEEARRRVLAVARELHYEPNVAARSLASRKTQLVAAVVPMLTNFFFIEVIRGMQDALAPTDFDLLVYSAPAPEDAETQIQQAMQAGRSEATLIFSTPLTQKQAVRIQLASRPVVLVDSMHEGIDSVAVDNRLGGEMAAGHLLEAGYERLALIMGYPASVPAAGRKAGYLAALQARGIAADSALILASDDEKRHGFTEAFGYEAMHRLARLGTRPGAVFATSDTQALGAMRAAEELGIRIPEEMGLIGFDDIMISRYVGLSTLRQPMYEMGRKAIEKLLLRMEEPERQVSHTVFSPELIVRETTNPAG